MWEKYIDDRLIKRHPKFSVIKPVDAEPAVPLCCPVCDMIMRNSDDEEAYVDVNCCHSCAFKWAHSRRTEWKLGWRPSQEEILQAVSERPNKIIEFPEAFKL